MAHTEIMRDVPADSLDEVVADYRDAGAEVTTSPQPNGLFTVTAVFRDSPARAAVAERHGAVDVTILTFRQLRVPHEDRLA